MDKTNVIQFPVEKAKMVTVQKDPTEIGEVARLRQLKPGDVLDVVRTLRRLMVQVKSAGYTLYADFDELGGDSLEQEAEKTRRTLELASTRISALVTHLEKTKAYTKIKDEHEARNKDKDSKEEDAG